MARRTSTEELIECLQNMTPEQLKKMLSHPVTVRIMEDARKELV